MRRAPRGQAVTELSLLMIVILPLIFYTLFLDDLLRHRLDMLEAVVSSPWDYGAIDQEGSNGASLQQEERLSWCDHTLAYNSHDGNYECDNAGVGVHHVAMTAHVCWVVEGGEQVTCSTDGAEAKIDDNAGYNGGGLTTCHARAGVFNYFLPQKILSEFEDHSGAAKVTSAETWNDAVHSHYNAASANIYMLEKQQFGLIHDTWATKTPSNIDAYMDYFPAMLSSALKQRAQDYYDGESGDAVDKGNEFFDDAKEELVDEGASSEPLGDDLSTIHMSFNSSPGTGFGLLTKHTSSAWSDSRVESTGGARVDEYFGVPESEW